jgi:Ca2+-binding RTX toxin-like protein
MATLYRRKGGDTLVNTQTASSQTSANLSVLQDGGYVVVWTDSSQIGADTSGSGVKAQRFDANGDKVGGEFLVNTTTVAGQGTATVATLPSGRFVVTWTDLSATGGDTSSRAIRGQLFEANGTAVGSEFLVNTQTAGNQDSSAVTELAGGGFVVSWADSSGVGGDNNGSGIKAQLFDSTAAKVGGEILVNTTIAGNQVQPSMIGLPGGGFAAVWTSSSVVNGTVVGRAWLQMFDSAGNKVGAEQAVSEAPVPNVITANIAALASGFVVTWAQQDSFAAGPVTFDIMGQIFDSAGVKVSGNFGVHDSPGSQNLPDAHALPGGGFLLTWQGSGEGFSNVNIFGQVFNAFGGRMGVPFVISNVTALGQLTPEVEVLPSGDIVVVWTDSSGSGGDPDFAIRSQILTVSTAPPTDIALSHTTISETAREGVPLAVLSTVGTLNSLHSYAIVSDSSGGAFGIDGDKLVVNDNSLIDYETAAHQVEVRIRTTDENGNSYEETFQLDIADTPEAGYAPDGDEFPVNTIAQNNQTEPVLTPLESGGYVALWIEWPLGGNGTVVSKGQIFDAAGAKVGGELAIKGDAAAALPGGGFVTTWTQGVSQANFTDIRAQIYDSAGAAVGGEISVNAAVAGYQQFPSVATLPSGGFVISWTDSPDFNTSRIFAQIFLPGGTKFGPEFQVGPNGGVVSEVAVLAGGNFAVAWSSNNAILAQIFAPDGTRFGVEFVVDSLSGFVMEPHIAALAGGGFVVTYALNSSSGGYVGIDNLSAQIIDANGIKVGSEILISADGPSQVNSVDVVALPWGGFVVGWSDHEDGDPATNDSGTRAQVFDSTGARIGAELAVNQVSQGDQIQTELAVLASGDVVVAWAGSDSSGFGIRARTLSPLDPSQGGDVLYGTPGADVIDGLGGDDQIYGLGDSDQLTGGSGDDLLDGGAGADVLTGGDGDDIYVVDDAGDVVTEDAGEGVDEVRTGLATYVLAADVENLTAVSNLAHNWRGNAGDNVVTGGSGNDLLRLQDGGNDTVLAGAGADILFFIGSLTSADIVNGGADADTLVVQGNYAGGLTLSANVTQIENVTILGGNNTSFGEPGTNLYDYVLTTNNANFAAGVQARINGAALLAGEDFTFDGSAETDASFVVYGGKGKDTLTGSYGNDVFIYAEERFAPGDTVNGGPAGYDGIFFRGNYTIDFNAPGYFGLMTSIENMTLTSITDERYARGGDPAGFDYNITLADNMLLAGVVLTVSGTFLGSGETMVVDGSLETDGSYRFFAGKADDVLKGGANNDLLLGNLGADQLTGGGGADTFRYDSTADSTAASLDHILDFTPGTDKIELSRTDANTLVAGDQAFTWIGSNAFSGVAGQLRAFQQGGEWIVQGDANGDGAADLVIALTLQGPTPLGAGDFLL